MLIKIETLIVGQMQTNCYLVWEEKQRNCLIIDPGDDADFIISRLSALNLKPQAILATHGHFDHILGVQELKLAYNIPFYLHKKDLGILKRMAKTAKYFTNLEVDPPAQVDHFLYEGQLITVGDHKLQVKSTPGHTQGSISFILNDNKQKYIFCGDLLFKNGGQGRTDLEGGDYHQLRQSIKKILKFSPKTIIYPGHGGPTNVRIEKNYY